MRKLIYGVAGLTAICATSAMAADLPVKAPIYKAPPPMFSWTGCYIGAYVGGAWGSRNTTQDLNGYNRLGDQWSYNTDASFIGGGTLGCNYQVNNVVLGIENEIGYLNLKGSAFDPFSPFLPLDTESHVKVGSWYDVIAGRLGLAFDRTLLYVKGGAVITRVNYGVIDASTAGTGTNLINATTSKTQTGFAAGGGIEYAFTPNWSVKAEYLFLDVRASDDTCGNAVIGGGRFCWSNDFKGVHTAKIGLNYRFGGGPVFARY